MEQIMTEYDRIVKKHANEIPCVQKAIDPLTEVGLTVADEDLISLSYEGAKLREQAVSLATKEAEKFKISFRREQEKENIAAEFFQVIETARNNLRKALKSDYSNPLSPTAYHIQDGKVYLSTKWEEEMRLQYDPEETEARKKAKILMNKAIAAIEALNAFVADNPYLGKGVTSSLDDRRCLIWIDGEGNIHREDNNLKFI